jgi:AcrR family transcriptional regulator
MTPRATPDTSRATQADRRARTRTALLTAAAQEISRHGYSDMVLERVARDAGYTRGALYHLFANKQDLAIAVVEWVGKSWYDEVGVLLDKDDDPVGTLIAVARETAVYFRHDVARVLTRLRKELFGFDHPVGRTAELAFAHMVADITRLVAQGREAGAIPPGPPPRVLALAYLGSMEGVLDQLAGQTPFDAACAERATLGVLGLAPRPDSAGPG